MKRKQPFRSRYLRFLRDRFNPVTLRVAYGSHSPLAIVQHVGRRSGKHYETPVMVQPVADGFVIELTYGPEVDWYKNVQAAGGCSLLWHGKEYRISRIEPMDPETGRVAFPLPARFILRLIGAKHFLKLIR